MKSKWFTLLFIISILFPIQAYADNSEKILIQQAFLPNTTYTTKFNTTSSNTLIIEGKSDSVKEKLKDYKFPIKMEYNQIMTIVMTTDNIDSQGNIPFTSKFVKNKTITIINGKSEPPESENAGNILITGFYDNKNNKINISSVKGENLLPKTEDIIKKMYENMQNKVQFPSTPIKIGDTFVKQFNTQIPVPNFQPIDIAITSTYTLTSIKMPLAIFAVESNIKLLSKDSKELKIALDGGGEGTVQFDVKNKCLNNYTTPMNTKAIIDMPDMTMTIMSNSNSIIDYQVNPNISKASSN